MENDNINTRKPVGADATGTATAADKPLPHVVIVGGGFGGLYAARALARHPVRVTLADRRNYHLFQPLLYQVATAALSAGDIATPIRSILSRYRNVHVLLAEATAVDLAQRRVVLHDDELHYDYLIIAAGATASYFGHDEWEPFAPSLKAIDDALEVRRRILCAYEAAERETDEAARHELMTFVIVGAGPTGVELAGAIAEIARETLKHDFRAIDPAQTRVLLLQGKPRVLPEYPEDLSASAQRQLQRLGVEVRTGAIVTDISRRAVHIGDETIPARTILWAAGVKPAPLAEKLGVPLDHGHVPVQADLTLAGHPEVYVIGDIASFKHQTGQPLPGLAPVAIQQGKAAAANICRTLRDEPRQTFHYNDRGTMATIGRAAAVGQIKRFHISGLLAWLAWLFVHIFFLIGFANRFVVIFRWAWSYVTYNRGARLITGAGCEPEIPAKTD